MNAALKSLKSNTNEPTAIGIGVNRLVIHGGIMTPVYLAARPPNTRHKVPDFGFNIIEASPAGASFDKSAASLYKDRGVFISALNLMLFSETLNEVGTFLSNTAVKPVNFFCNAPQARSVYLIGDFNNWKLEAHPMDRRLEGWWFLQLLLTHGHHHYKFVVDGKAVLDPQAIGVAYDERQGKVSLMAVS